MSEKANPKKTQDIEDVETLDVLWPDGHGRNCILVFEPLLGPTVRVSLSKSASDELRRLLMRGTRF